MKTAYEYLKNNYFIEWDSIEKNRFYQWIMKNVKIISRYTENEPLQEFLCLNEKKTKFSSTDYDRAYQLKYQSEIDNNITTDMIIKEHAEIQKYLYTNDYIFDLIKEKHEGQLPTNRMDFIFEKFIHNKGELSEYYDNIDKCKNREEKYEKAYKYLKECHKILRSIHEELKEIEKYKLNVNIYNAIKMLYKLDPGFSVFDLVDDDNKSFEEKIKEKFKKYPNGINFFIESQLICELKKDGFKEKEFLYSERKQYVLENILNIFYKKIKITEELIERGRNYIESESNISKNKDTENISYNNIQEQYILKEACASFDEDERSIEEEDIGSELVRGGKKSFKEVFELSKIKQIIIPSIQRDYTIGSHEDYFKKLLFDISKTFLISKLPYPNKYEKGAAELVVYNCFREGILWNMPEVKINGYYISNEKLEKYRLLRQQARYSLLYYTSKDREGKQAVVNETEKLKKRLSLLKEKIPRLKKGDFFPEKVNNTEKTIFLFSVIFGFLQKGGNFYVYDGQQRIVTLVYLIAYFINNNYNTKNEERKKTYEVYIELLKKFRFQERKRANQLLSRLLDINNTPVTSDMIKEYVVDHSTYSIWKMIQTYEDYQNGYDNQILSFDVEYLMEQVVFEFAVIQEASIADQMYMDLNSKNEKLTPYEIYKSELVFTLNSKFEELYKKDWEKQLDNNFLNKCYKLFQESDQWSKDKANEAEELEIKIIHWCFKMAAMEYGIKVKGIKKDKEDKGNSSRLDFMENNNSENIVKIAGEILNKKIFTDDLRLNKIKEFIESATNDNSKIVDFDISYTLEEFKQWHELRYTEKLNKFKYTKFDRELVRVHNSDKEELIKFAEYLYQLFNPKDSNDLKPKIIEFLLKKYHMQWEKGYLESYSLVNILENQENQGTIDKLLNYFDKMYLSSSNIPDNQETIDKPCNYLDNEWFEYIYTVKINERLNIELYDKVKDWEDLEYKEKIMFSSDEKKLAWEKFDGSCEMFKYYNDRIKELEKDTSLECKIDSGCEVNKKLIDVMKERHLKLFRIKYMNSNTNKTIYEDLSENSKEDCSIQLDYSSNIEIYNKICDKIHSSSSSTLVNKIAEEIKENYYFDRSGDRIVFYKWSEDAHNYDLVEEVEIGSFKINEDCLHILYKTLDKQKNTNKNKLRYMWTTCEEKWLKDNLKILGYDEVLKILDFCSEDVKEKWREYYDVLPHD